jgi:basic membrane lipoprotein Med (substrate-binding protein (PBP1-ABC) superfamily)
MRHARRRLLGFGAAAAVLPGLHACASRPRGPERGPFVAILPASLERDGTIEATRLGIQRVESELKVRLETVEGIDTSRGEAVFAALRAAARPPVKMVIGFGGALGGPMQRVAWEFPEQRFTLVDGDAAFLRPNLAIYDVLETQAVWVAGAAAGLSARRGVGFVPDPGAPEGATRAAFVAGLREAAREARLVDAPAGATGADALAALARGGIDVAFLAAPAIDDATLAAARATGVRCIGTGRDWTRVAADVFLAAVVRDPGRTLLAILKDLDDAVWRGDVVRRLGLRSPAVRLALAPDVPASLQSSVLDYRDQVLAGRFDVPGVTPRYTAPALR